MPPDIKSNIYFFKGPDDAPQPAGEDVSRVDEMKSIASCLEYLYGEAVRLDVRMSAHLIGAAAESLREQLRKIRDGEET